MQLLLRRQTVHRRPSLWGSLGFKVEAKRQDTRVPTCENSDVRRTTKPNDRAIYESSAVRESRHFDKNRPG